MDAAAQNNTDMRRNLVLGCVFMLMYLLVYGSISLRSGLVWDEMLDAEGTATGMYVASGRWGLGLYRLVFGEGVFPVVASLAAGVFISASLVWQVRLFGLREWLAQLFYGAVYLACIQWAYQLEYSHQSDAVALGLLGSTAAVHCLRRGRWVWCVLLAMAAYGMYQTVALHTLCLLLALELAEKTPGLRQLAKGAACVVCGLVLSCLVARLSFLLPWVSEDLVAANQAYQYSLSRWSELPADATWGEVADFAWYYGSRFFKMTCKNILGCAYAGQWVFATALLPLAMLLARSWRRGGQGRLLRCAGFLLLCFLPFCPILLLFSDQGARVDLAEPLALAALWGLWLRGHQNLRPGFAVALVALAASALLKSSYRVGDIAYNEARIFEQEVACVRSLHARGMAAAEAAGVPAARIILLGHIPAHREVTWPRLECFGEHHGMTPPEQLGFYTRYLYIDNMDKGTDSDMLRHEAVYRTMSTWPAAGSVRVVGGEVIIRVD